VRCWGKNEGKKGNGMVNVRGRVRVKSGNGKGLRVNG